MFLVFQTDAASMSASNSPRHCGVGWRNDESRKRRKPPLFVGDYSLEATLPRSAPGADLGRR